MLEDNQHQTAKACQVQLHIILLSTVLVTIGLAAFTNLYFRGPSPPTKLFFQLDMAKAETLIPLSLDNTSPFIQRPLWLAHHQPNQQMR